MAWLGPKRIAFIPLYRTNPPDAIPTDWEEQIWRRILFDVGTHVDMSLRTYIHTVSSGRADVDAFVLSRERADQEVVPVDYLEAKLGAQLRAEGFDAAAIVMLGGQGAGTAEQGGFWARFVMDEFVGVWAMELMHVLTGFADLYPFDGNLDAFDEMACSCATHPTAYTKTKIQWLDDSAVAVQNRREGDYNLHAVGLIQPPPPGRFAAVRIGADVPYLMIEARQRVDQFDIDIPSEGVIVYRVQTGDPLGNAENATAPVELLTPTAIKEGESFSSSDLELAVKNSIAGGFSVHITRATPAVCAGLFQQIATLEDDLKHEPDPDARRGLRS